MNKLRLYRGKANLTQRDLAKKVGLSYTTIYLYENNGIPADKAPILAEALNCTPFELYGEDIFNIPPKTDDEIQTVVRYLIEITTDPVLKAKLEGVVSWSEKM